MRDAIGAVGVVDSSVNLGFWEEGKLYFVVMRVCGFDSLC